MSEARRQHTAVLLVATLLLFGSIRCSGDDDDGGEQWAGACVQGSYSSSKQWCYNHKDTEQRTGEEACAALSVTAWHDGKTCEELGFTKQCPSGTWFLPSDDCL